MVLIGQTQEIGEIDMPPSKKGKKKSKKTVSQVVADFKKNLGAEQKEYLNSMSMAQAQAMAYSLSWEDLYKRSVSGNQKVEVKSEGDIVLTPWKLRMFEKCNTRLMDIYDKVIEEQRARSLEMSNRLIAKLRGTTMGGA